MNKVLKMLIIETIHNNVIVHDKIIMGDKYIVFNRNKQEILSVINSWANNFYSVFVNGKPVLSVKWDETNSRPLTPDQKDMLDILNVAREKIDLQETAQTMNKNELEIANFLQQSLCSTKH